MSAPCEATGYVNLPKKTAKRKSKLEGQCPIMVDKTITASSESLHGQTIYYIMREIVADDSMYCVLYKAYPRTYAAGLSLKGELVDMLTEEEFNQWKAEHGGEGAGGLKYGNF